MIDYNTVNNRKGQGKVGERDKKNRPSKQMETQGVNKKRVLQKYSWKLV